MPQLFVSAGATRFNDPKNFPWTVPWYTRFEMEARIYAEYILQTKPDAKIAVLYQNDDFGKDYLGGAEEAPRPQGRRHDRRRGELRARRSIDRICR